MAVQLVVVSAGATLPPIPILPSLATAAGSQGVTWKGGFGGACAISCSTAPLKINEAKAKAAVLRNHGMITSSVVRLDVLVLSSSPASKSQEKSTKANSVILRTHHASPETSPSQYQKTYQKTGPKDRSGTGIPACIDFPKTKNTGKLSLWRCRI